MAEIKERIRGLRQVEHGVLSNVENANGIVTLLKELGRENETSVAVAATHCLRRVFAQLLDPAKNPQLPRPAAVPSTSSGGGLNSLGTTGKEGKSKSKKNKKRARSKDEDTAVEAMASRVSSLDGVAESDDDRAARVYQAWLEARYFDFLRVLLGWIAEVDDFHRQGPALRTLMQFVEIEPVLCVSAAKFSRVGRSGVGEQSPPGAGTIWGGLFAELMRVIILGPCSMQPKLLKSLGEDFVNVHDDIRYFLLANVSSAARQALSDNDKLKEQQQRLSSAPAAAATPSSKSTSPPPRFRLPADSPLRGFQGTAGAFTDTRVDTTSGGKKPAASVPSASPPGTPASKKRKKRKKAEREGGGGDGDGGLAVEEQEEERGGQKMELAEVSGRLARVLMVVRMVEEQSDLSAFLLPVRLSLPSSSLSAASLTGGKFRAGAGEGGGDQEDLRGDASSSSSDSDDDSGDEEEGKAAHASGKAKGGKKVAGNKKGKGKGKGGGTGETSGGKKRMLAIERLRYHKKAFGDAWLACLRLPLPPALYRRVLLFLPGNVIPYMPSPIRLADFLTAAYDLGGVQAVLALDALFLLMQSHDLDYPGFYDSLYRLVTPDMMYAKYRARFFRMVDLCLTSSHVPAYVVAAFLKRFARACLQAPPSGALFTLALVRKLIGRHPECQPLISRKNSPASGSKDPNRLLTSSGALSGTTGLKNRPLPSSSGGGAGGDTEASVSAEGEGRACADEYDPDCQDLKGAGAMNTSLWELAALQNHYHPAVATLARGFLLEADKKEAEGEAFAGPSKLAGETYQSLFDQEMRRKVKDVPLAFRRPNGLFDDVPEEGGGVFAAVNFSIS